jgi:ADP-ribose pyrophosphatase
MDRDDIDVVNKDVAYQGHFRIDRYRLRHRKFDGGWSQALDRELFERGHAVAVALYDPDRHELVLIEQFRPGAMSAAQTPWYDGSPWLLECVAGIIDEGESPEDVVRREALEESGCTVSNLEYVCKYLASPGASSETVFVYCGQVDSSRAGGVHGLDHEGEDIRVIAVPVDEAMAWLDEGRFVNALTIIALQWFRHHQERLRRAWRTAGGARGA